MTPGEPVLRQAADRHPQRGYHAAAALGLAAVLAASAAGVDRLGAPKDGRPALTLCFLRQWTGFPCATCGMTRSFCAVARGDLGAAVRHHPLGPLTFLVFVLLLVRSAGIALTGRRWLDGLARVLAWCLAPAAALLLAAWIWRLAAIACDGTAGALWRGSLLGRLFVPGA